VGVPRGVRKSGDRLHLPFQHDFAVLKIDTLPEGIQPLPMAEIRDPLAIKRLSPVIIMGFPLGSRTQDERINASITRGHVRRTSKELIQVDASIYKGNSGGPAVNADGRVIGIASGVVTDQPSVQIPLTTPLSDFGLVLPIDKPARFVDSLKAGQPKWDGILDFTLDKKLNQVLDLAAANDFDGAAKLSRQLLEASQDPALIFTSALLDFCRNDLDASKKMFTRLISIEGNNNTARLMLYIIDWLTNINSSTDLTRELFTLSWQHPDEFMGYLARILDSEQRMDTGFIDFENQSEKAWRWFLEGMIIEKQGDPADAIKVFKEIVMTAGANDHLYFMAMSRLNRLMELQLAFADDKTVYRAEQAAFWEAALEQRQKAKTEYDEAMVLIRDFESQSADHEDKVAAYTKLRELAPDNRTIIGRLAFYHAGRSEWKEALSFIDLYFKAPARETALSLSLGLMKGQLLKLTGDSDAGRSQISRFKTDSENTWYGILGRQLLEGPSESELVKLAANSPAKRITLHTALGLDAEGNKNREQASHHYREALGTYLDSWNEYDLAKARLLRFRQVN
ncbi:MAG: trypsin-like peptidase domain-containing protein, partial [Desulfobacterales bacterium]|nr:trypsin-like peptidase domain-containing protein [Desulfobacterales bacterium]